jgi:hypothetical protein
LQDGVAAVRALLERAEAWRGIAPHYDVEPMNVGAAFAALEMEARGFVDREAIRAEVPQAQEEAVRQALAAHPELDPAVTLSALISPVTAEAHERLVARAKQQARKAVLTKHGLRRLPQRERLQIAASAGIGKTKAVIDAIAAKNAPLVVNVFVPTHKLAGGLADRFEQPGVRAYVIRGRTAAGPDGNPMCRHSKLADALGKAGAHVKKSLCKNEFHQCEHYQQCAFMRQVRDIETGNRPTVIIMPHSYLVSPKPKWSDWQGLPAADFAVVDESALSALCEHKTLKLSDLGKSEPWRGVPESAMGEMDDFLTRCRTIRDAFKDVKGAIRLEEVPLPPLSEIEAAAAFASEHARGVYMPGLLNMEEDDALARVGRLERCPGGAITRMLKTLAAEMKLGRGLLHGVEVRDDEVRLHWRRKPKLGTEAVLIIDADADESIGRVLWGRRLRHLSLPVRRNAIVTQVTDATFSKSSLIDLGWQSEKALKTAGRTRERVSRFIGDCVTVYGSNKVLVVANKPVRCALTGENPSATLPAAADLGGAAIAHFGNIRGIDAWKDYACVVIVGREQPRPEAVEAQARALYWDDPEPLGLTGAYGTERRGYRLNSDCRAGADVWVHPDPRVQRLHELPREREVGQAVDRLRLVHREQPAHVYLLGSLPVDVTVDRLIDADDLLREVAIQAALKRRNGVLPLTPKWLMVHEALALVPGAHRDKPSERALKYAISGLVQRFEAASGGTVQDTGEVETQVLMKGQKSNKLIYGPLPFHGGGPACSAVEPWRLFRYRIVGSRGGKPRLALVAPDQANPTAVLAALLERPVLAVDEQSDEEGSDGADVAAVTVCVRDPRLRRRRTWIRAQLRIPRSGAPPGLRRCPSRRGGARYWSGATSRGPQAACGDFLTRRRAVQ